MAIAVVHAHLVLAAIAIVTCMAAAGMVGADPTVAAVPGAVVDEVVGLKAILQVVAVTVQVQQHLEHTNNANSTALVTH